MATVKTDVRLKSVLDILTENALSGEASNAGKVLAEALVRVPPTEHEKELLSGGIPRGHKNLSVATGKLVKAGWMTKGRSGWTVTDEGQRATVAFPDAASFTAALAAGTPVPEGTLLPVLKAPKKSAAAKKPAVRKASTRKPAAAAGVAPAAAPVGSTSGSASETPAAEPVEAAAFESAAAANPPSGQPSAVALAGDFNTILGAPEDWNPALDQAQMSFDPAEVRWKLSADLPAGHYTYKVALDRSWVENYGAYGVRDGANHELHHAGGRVNFIYDHTSRDIRIQHGQG
ncbi:pullulanase X25 domain-containing protein [Arthrobacter halodurans]|uniref:Glycosidase n=1 Tax=Arthrobacter halodurans TaxID=516699 RepID=A0ABV4UN19_9MICC